MCHSDNIEGTAPILMSSRLYFTANTKNTRGARFLSIIYWYMQYARNIELLELPHENERMSVISFMIAFASSLRCPSHAW